MTHLFFLGRVVDLCRAELEVVLLRYGVNSPISEITATVVGIQQPDLSDETVQKMMKDLGGVVKIATNVSFTSSENVTNDVALYLIQQNQPKIRFGISVLGPNTPYTSDLDLHGLKLQLKEKNIVSRYIETNQHGVEAAIGIHHEVQDLFVLDVNDEKSLFRTVAFQDIDSWSQRDFGKPYRDMKKGMLPPKLARILVNLGVADQAADSVRLFDPFCGTGTVLLEALELGLTQVGGADISAETIHGAGTNLHWYCETQHKSETYSLSIQDAVHITQKETGALVDCIVTEPFLGKQNPKEEDIPGMFKGLEKMYLGALKQWSHVLKRNGRVVIILPYVAIGSTVKTLQSVIDRIESLGYTREKGPYLYSRPQTTVQRQVFVLQRKKE